MARSPGSLPSGLSRAVVADRTSSARVVSAPDPRPVLTRFTSDQFEVSVITSVPPTVLVAGDLSASTAPILRAVLDGQLELGHVHLRLDLSRLTQATAAGLSPVVSCRRRCRASGGRASLHGVRASAVVGLGPVVATLTRSPGGAG